MEDLGERTEEATPRRLQEAREDGHVARSADFAAAIVLLGTVLILWAGAVQAMSKLAMVLRDGLAVTPHLTSASSQEAAQWGLGALTAAAKITLPLLVGAWLVAYASHFVQVGWLFAPAAVQPKLARLNPINGCRRIFGAQALVRAGMDGTKVLMVLIVVAISISARIDEVLLLPNLELGPAMVVAGGMLRDLAIIVVVALLMLGTIDLAWQKWKHRRDLRMSRVEIREELKQTEGDPGTRRRRYRMQQQIAMQRLTISVPKADVIIANPDRIAVAIQYDEATMRAPRVVAKGQEFAALRIRQIATQYAIPVIERQSLARALYRSVEIGQEIPQDYYRAIAEILAHRYRSGPSAGPPGVGAGASR